MSKKIILIIIAIIIIAGIGYWFFQSKSETEKTTEIENVVLDQKNCTYSIENKNITLKDGYSEEEIAPGSASKLITRYFGNEVFGDFNGDGLDDIAFLLTQSSGGSGTFYYLVVALGSENGCKGTNAILLGDRIAPQTTEFRDGEIIVNYAERKPGEPMTATPSVGVSKYFKISAGGLVEIEKQENKTESVIGKSAGGNDILAYHYGSGEKEILFIGGIHGGYSWNTALLTYQIMDYLKENPNTISSNIKVTVIPVLNPDGLKKVAGTTGRFSQTDVSPSQEVKVSGRFNANNVDINRNFDCGWKAAGVWQSMTVSGGSKPFSEPESVAIRDYVQKHKPTLVVSWDSAAGGVFSSSCNNDDILPETKTIANIYAGASGYPAYEDFTFYELSGDMIDWLAKSKIPAISVLLSTHEGIEWDKNLAGIKAIFDHYSK